MSKMGRRDMGGDGGSHRRGDLEAYECANVRAFYDCLDALKRYTQSKKTPEFLVRWIEKLRMRDLSVTVFMPRSIPECCKSSQFPGIGTLYLQSLWIGRVTQLSDSSRFNCFGGMANILPGFPNIESPLLVFESYQHNNNFPKLSKSRTSCTHSWT